MAIHILIPFLSRPEDRLIYTFYSLCWPIFIAFLLCQSRLSTTIFAGATTQEHTARDHKYFVRKM